MSNSPSRNQRELWRFYFSALLGDFDLGPIFFKLSMSKSPKSLDRDHFEKSLRFI